MAHRLAARQVTRSVAAAVVVGVALLAAAPAQAAFPGVNGKIAFARDVVGGDGMCDDEIDTINPDGTGLTALTPRTSANFAPSWSADGQKIAYVRVPSVDCNGVPNWFAGAEIWVMYADGGGKLRLTNNASVDTQPAWSPDGSKIAFMSERDGDSEIYVMNADGSAQTRLTANSSYDSDPQWSPDGQKIAFGHDGHISTMNPDGTGQTQLTSDSPCSYDCWFDSGAPSWSPDGQRLVFTRYEVIDTEYVTTSLWLVNADGTGETQFDYGYHFSPAWSPDGEKIAYHDGYGISFSTADGSSGGIIYHGTAPDYSTGFDPDWQPLPTAPYEHAHSANGKIAFHRGVTGNGNDVFTMNPDGTNQVNVTNQPGDDRDPEWSADGQRIAFSHDARIRVMNADGSGQSQVFGPTSLEPTWSPDGQLAFAHFWTPPPIDENPQQRDIFTINPDGTGIANLTNDPAFDGDPAWSPGDGAVIAFDSGTASPTDIYTINTDGTGLTALTSDGRSTSPQWSPDGSKIAYSGNGGVQVMNRDGTGQTVIASGSAPAWSPDGKKIVFQRPNAQDPFSSDVWVMNADGSAPTMVAALASRPSWQPLRTTAYEHPQSAQSLSTSLVPTFRPCGTGANPTDGQHSPPLGTQACLPPTPGSNVARVGSTSVGSASFTVVPGDTDPTNGDQANVTLLTSLSDVKTPGGADYVPSASGPDLTEITRLRLTDMANNYGGASGTATEYDFRVPIDCSATADPAVGSACSTSTSADSLLPGFITEQRQTVVQAFRVRVDDAGANGTTGDSDDRIFATQGIYVP